MVIQSFKKYEIKSTCRQYCDLQSFKFSIPNTLDKFDIYNSEQYRF
jgi:hypothetical protein